MFELLLVACFTAFFLALLDSLIELLSMMVSAIAVNATFSLLFSALGNFLVETHTLKSFIIKTFAGAFLGKVFIKVTERLTSYRPAPINPTRQ